ncbi:MAG: outer membrane lipoprotein-sorting protein [Deltaproteobacteria bacterium]|nr:outer membrane lipoprotein-sorting protein [Deltaproteobacteria bacterium]
MKKRNVKIIIGVVSLLIGLTDFQNSMADNLSAREIMVKNFYASKVADWTTESNMTLINDKGQERVRRTVGITKLAENGIDSMRIIRFLSPPDVKGTAILTIEHFDGDDDVWIYLPALKKVRRLVANNKKDSFVGSDFSYGDIISLKVDDYHHKLVKEERVSDYDCFVIESTPKDERVKGESGYSKKITWVAKESFVEIKAEYFDLDGRLLKVQEISEIKQVDKDRWIALRRLMTNYQTGHKTLFIFQNLQVNKGVSHDIFAPREIERQ